MDAPGAPPRMTRDEYRLWAAGRSGRFELVHGEVVQMSAERWAHSQIKGNLFVIFRREIKRLGLPCRAAPDGMTVEIDEDTDYEPDALINGGRAPDPDSITAPNPIVVAEVLSPGTRRVDLSAKLAGYFRVASIQHYLVALPDRAEVIHHRRAGDGVIETRIASAGAIRLDPPGIEIDVAEIFAD